MVVLPGSAQSQTTPREKADAMWASVASHVADRQADYFAAHGRFFQGIRTHQPRPKDGAEAAPETNRRPTDQAEDWNGAGFALPAFLEIHVYDDPAGKGYVAILEVEVAGSVWRRSVGADPEAVARTRGWLEIREGP
jgi:hypothetical protein